MGVLNCDRTDCDNIMCDYYLSDFGYICRECKDEFNIQYIHQYYKLGLTIETAIMVFLKTSKVDDYKAKEIEQVLDNFWSSENTRDKPYTVV